MDYSQDNNGTGSPTDQGLLDDPAYTIEQALNNLQQTDDPSARYYAAWWIGRFRVNEPVAIQLDFGQKKFVSVYFTLN